MSPSIQSSPFSAMCAVVAGHELAGASGLHAAGAIRDVDVVRLGRADPVEHLDAERRPASGRAAPSGAPRRPTCTGAGRRHVAADTRLSVWTVWRPSAPSSSGPARGSSACARRSARRSARASMRSGKTMPAAPTPNGKSAARSRAYPKKSFGTGRTTSSGRRSRTPRAYQSKLSTGLWVGWTAAFGCPVDPVVNFQSAMSSLVVGAGSSSSVRRARAGSVNDSSHDEDLSEPAASLGGLAGSPPRRRLVGDDDAGARVVEVVGVVLRLEEGVRLGGDRPDLLRAVPEGDELDGVGEHEQHAFLGA